MVDMTDFFDRPQNEKRSPDLNRPKLIQSNASHLRTAPHTHTKELSANNTTCQAP